MKLYTPVERWKSRSTFVLALAASAVGFGNLWRYAYLMGENGGASFLLSYAICLFFVAVPLLVAEVLLGQHGRGSPLMTLRWATATSQRSRLWVTIVPLACMAAAALLVCYQVVGGWTLALTFHQQLGSYAAISLAGSAEFFMDMLADPTQMILWQMPAALISAALVAAGVRRGLGTLMWVAVPTLVVLFAALINYAIEHGDLEAAGAYLFRHQAMDFDSQSFLVAFGHALYTLGVGLAVGLSFGAYAPDKLPIVRSVLAIALFDLVIAVAAGVAIFPLIFANNLLPAQGVGLLFVSLPYAFGNIVYGDLFGALFFLAAYVALLASVVALLEPMVAVLTQQFHLPRFRAAFALSGLLWLLSAIAAISLSGDGELFIRFDHLAVDVLIPMAVLGLALFVGWRMPRTLLRRELAREPDILFNLWYFLLRFVAPPVVIGLWIWSWWLQR